MYIRFVKYCNVAKDMGHCKKRLAVFPSPAGMSLTKLSLAGNYKIIPRQVEFGKCHPSWGRVNR